MGQASQRDFGAASGRSRQAAPLAGEGEASRARRGDCSEHCLEAGVSFSRSTGYKLMRIARQFDAEIAERYGVEKLELGLGYLEATPERERPHALVMTDLRVRDANGRFRSVSFHEATPSQIKEAILLASASSSSRKSRSPRQLHEL